MYDLPNFGASQRSLPASSTKSQAPKILRYQFNLPDLEITPVLEAGLAMKICEEIPKMHYKEKITKTSKDEKAINKLLSCLPILDQNFVLHKKIGEGTYSSVYLASLRNSKSPKQFAIKHLTDNFSLQRIQKELRFMQTLGGRENVINVLNSFKSTSEDCVVFVMPYLPHKRFSDYCFEMDANELRTYMKNLFIALRRVHSFNVIHRDVKPGNFLYNRDTGEFLLVDFGLAQEVNETLRGKSLKRVEDENQPINYSSKRKRSSTDDGCYAKKTIVLSPLKSRENVMNQTNCRLRFPSTTNSPLISGEPQRDVHQRYSPMQSSLPANILSNSKSLNMPRQSYQYRRETSLSNCFEKSQAESNLSNTSLVNKEANIEECQSFTPLVSGAAPVQSFVQVRNSQVIKDLPSCTCSGTPSICAPCSGKRALLAPRAGTPGFRPPEVLLKSLYQTTAVDMWAAGIVLLCVLSGTYPFFKSPNDLAALMEIITVFGTDAVQKIAVKFGRRLPCSEIRPPLDLKKMCRRRRARFINEKYPVPASKCHSCFQTIREDGCMCSLEALSSANVHYNGDKFPDSAYHLLSRLLDLDPDTRLTAAEALHHPFITKVTV